MELTREELIDAINTGVQKAVEKRFCYFSVTERHNLHEFADAIKDEGANRETHIIVLRIGINVQRFVKRAAQSLIWGLIILGAVAAYIVFVKPFWRP